MREVKAKVRLQKLQRGQQRYQAALLWVQKVMAALGIALVQDRNPDMCPLEHCNDRIFSGLAK